MKYNLTKKVKQDIDNYLEFDSSILFKSCDYLEIFGGAVRDSIADMEIHDIDILALSIGEKTCSKILENNGYKFMNLLNMKEIHEMYKDIHCIFEPRTFINKNLKIVQLIRPTPTLFPVENYFSKDFFELMREVDLSCCGVSFNGLHIRENCPDAVLHCQNGYYSINNKAKMYNENRNIMRTEKLKGRGWKDIAFLKDEELIDLDRFKKLECILNE